MQDEKQSQDEKQQQENQENQTNEGTDEHVIQHVYFEVGNDLLSKPNALSDLIQANGYPPCLIFCNSPSEADLVDVILKKHGIAAVKLIGHVPYNRISQALNQLNKREVTGVIVTDIAARELDPGAFEVIINYAIHEDPEIYIHRMTPHERSSKTQKIFSLVSPLDFGNFHYLKKVVDFEFDKGALPSAEEIARGESAKLFNAAKAVNYLEDEKIRQFVATITASPDRDALIAYLLHNTLVVLPERESKLRTEEHEDDGRERRDRRQDRRGGDRGERGDRGDRGERGGRDRRRQDRFERGGNYGEPQDNYERRESTPPKRDVRFYLGQGLNHGLTDELFRKTVETEAGVSAEQLKRLSIRDNYAFVDFDEEGADEIAEKLEALEIPGVGRLFIRRATTINVPREREEGADEGAQEEFGQTDLGDELPEDPDFSDDQADDEEDM